MCLRMNGLGRTRVVADPFLGLGSTAVACARLGLSFIGIETDEGYLEERAHPGRPARRSRTDNRSALHRQS